MATTTRLRLRDARDRLIDFLGLGGTYPLRDLVVRDEQLTVTFNTPARIPIEKSQRGVLYQLHEDGQPVLRLPNGNGSPGLPIQVEGTGDTIFLETNPIQEDITYEIFARKTSGAFGKEIEWDSGVYLHQAAVVKVGLDTSLRAWIREAPSLDPAVINPTGTQARLVFYRDEIGVEIENSQEGVDYHLVYYSPAAEEIDLSDKVLGDLANIILRTGPLTEDIEIRIRATKDFDPVEERDTETDLLAVELPLRVRANPDLALGADPAPVIGYRQPAAITIEKTQENVQYQLFGRAIRDRHFYPQLCLEEEGSGARWVHVPVPGEPDEVLICRPPGELLWRVPEGFTPWSEMLAGNGGELAFELDPLEADQLFIVCAQKQHRTNGKEIASQVELAPATAVLVGADPDPALRVQVTMNGEETDGRMLIMDGQPGVFYSFYLNPEEEALGLPAYFHQRDDTDEELNKGLDQLGVEIDFVIARWAPEDLPADAAPSPPIIETGPLPGGVTIFVRAKKAINRVSVPLNNTVRIPSLPQIRLQDTEVDYGTATKILVITSIPGDRYQPWLKGEPMKRARLGNGSDLSFNTEPLLEDTIFQVRVTRPDDAGIPVERTVNLQAVVRPA